MVWPTRGRTPRRARWPAAGWPTSPLHRATLGTLAVDAAGAFVLAGHAFALLGRVEVGADPDAAAELRMVAPLAKLATGAAGGGRGQRVRGGFGGAGYVEDTGVPRLLRDAQVLPIWEGTTNVLALDVLRATARDGRRRAAAAAGWTPPSTSPGGCTRPWPTALPRPTGTAACRRGVRSLADPQSPPVVAGAPWPGAADGVRAGYRAAGRAGGVGGRAGRGGGPVWARRWLRGEDIAGDAHRHLEVLG